MGSGPFPTELFDEDGERMRQIGMEFGATTGRPRRCGWLDMVALKYSVMMNGVTSLIMMKADVLNDFDRLKVAVAYRVNGERTTEFPFETAGEIVPEYREFEGWKCDINSMRSYDEFPRQLKEYIEFIERETGVPVKIISVGPTAKKRLSGKTKRYDDENDQRIHGSHDGGRAADDRMRGVPEHEQNGTGRHDRRRRRRRSPARLSARWPEAARARPSEQRSARVSEPE